MIVKYALNESNLDGISSIERTEVSGVKPNPLNSTFLPGELEDNDQGKAKLELSKIGVLDKLNNYIIRSFGIIGAGSSYNTVIADISNNSVVGGHTERYSRIWQYTTEAWVDISSKLGLSGIDFNLLINPVDMYMLTGSELNGIRVEEERLNESGTKIRYTVNGGNSCVATMNRYVPEKTVIIMANTRLPKVFPVYKFTYHIEPVQNKQEKLFLFHGNVINQEGIGIIYVKL